MLEIIDRERVEKRIEDWVLRIKKLYAEIETYYENLPTLSDSPTREILRGSILQTVEEPMERCDVLPRMIPTLSILYGKIRVSFVPRGLWILGINGRINITTNTQMYILVDASAYGDENSQWKIVTSRLANIHRDFDESVFLELVNKGEIE